ncbi:hypothetical protein B6D21_02690 [Gilliamella apis]|nr:hypothetical protein B6D21_02690 [Gilliamella apis]
MKRKIPSKNDYKIVKIKSLICKLLMLKIVIFKEGGNRGAIISNKQQITDAVFELSVFFFTKVNN